MKQKTEKGIERREENPDLLHPRLVVHVNQNAIKMARFANRKLPDYQRSPELVIVSLSVTSNLEFHCQF